MFGMADGVSFLCGNILTYFTQKSTPAQILPVPRGGITLRGDKTDYVLLLRECRMWGKVVFGFFVMYHKNVIPAKAGIHK
jgi:hypothetical protein